MFSQPLMGRFTDGTRTFYVQVTSSSIDLVDEDNEYYKEFNSLEELNNYLTSTLKSEPLHIPERVLADGKWYEFRVGGVLKCFAQNLPNGYTRCVTLQSYSEGEYFIFLWESNYSEVTEFINDSLHFVSDHNRNPENDLEVCISTMSECNPSDMDRVWCFNSLEEVNDLLVNHFGIPPEAVSNWWTLKE